MIPRAPRNTMITPDDLTKRDGRLVDIIIETPDDPATGVWPGLPVEKPLPPDEESDDEDIQ